MMQTLERKSIYTLRELELALASCENRKWFLRIRFLDLGNGGRRVVIYERERGEGRACRDGFARLARGSNGSMQVLHKSLFEAGNGKC
jgi:hypothetical protein